MCNRTVACPIDGEGNYVPTEFLDCHDKGTHCFHHFHTAAHPTVQFRCCRCGLEYLRPLAPHDGHGPFHPRYDR